MEALRKEALAVYIFWLRQIKRHFQSKTRIAASLAQPLLLFFSLGLGFSPVYAKATGADYQNFLAPGIMAMSILFTAMFSGVELISDKQFGFLKETLVAPVSRLSIVLGRTLGGATVAMFQGLIILLIMLAVGQRPVSWLLLPRLFLFMFMIALLFTALGTAIATLLDDMHAFPLIMNFVIMPMFFLSGALFPLDGLQGAFRRLLAINPLTYGVDGLRGSFLGAAHHFWLVDLGVLALVAALVLALGAYFFRKVEL